MTSSGKTSVARLALVGDLGGTHARFALADCSEPVPVVWASSSLRCMDFASAEQAIQQYLASANIAVRPSVAVLAAAGPVIDGAVRFTNNHWHCSESALHAMGFRSAKLLNDFEALAHAAALLGADDLTALGPQRSGEADGNIVVLGPGTGFGLSVLIRAGGTPTVLATEAGNVAFAPNDALEEEILKRLRPRLSLVCVESLLSGPGLINLYGALCEIAQQPVATPMQTAPTPATVTRLAAAGDALATETIQRFCEILGSVAGDAALAYGARGGIYVTGGVADALSAALLQSRFRERFEAKGRYADYVRAVPSALIRRPQPALLGAARVARTLALTLPPAS